MRKPAKVMAFFLLLKLSELHVQSFCQKFRSSCSVNLTLEILLPISYPKEECKIPVFAPLRERDGKDTKKYRNDKKVNI